jgi:hypothetical protein
MEMKPVTRGELDITGVYFQFVRPGSMDILKAPSRMGNQLIYPRENYGYEKSTDRKAIGKGLEAKGNSRKVRNKC